LKRQPLDGAVTVAVALGDRPERLPSDIPLRRKNVSGHLHRKAGANSVVHPLLLLPFFSKFREGQVVHRSGNNFAGMGGVRRKLRYVEALEDIGVTIHNI
jgi:hypothetical protein